MDRALVVRGRERPDRLSLIDPSVCHSDDVASRLHLTRRRALLQHLPGRRCTFNVVDAQPDLSTASVNPRRTDCISARGRPSAMPASSGIPTESTALATSTCSSVGDFGQRTWSCADYCSASSFAPCSGANESRFRSRTSPPTGRTIALATVGTTEQSHRGRGELSDALAAVVGATCDAATGIPVPVAFIREPENPYDRNACRAELQGERIRYLRRELAAHLAPALDSARCPLFEVCGVVRGGSPRAPNLGVHVSLDRLLTPGPSITVTDDPWVAAWPPTGREVVRLR